MVERRERKRKKFEEGERRREPELAEWGLRNL